MSPTDWAFRPLKKYASFAGRAPRAEYWWFYLAWFIGDRVLTVVDKALLGDLELLSIIFGLGLLVPWTAVMVRRLHDIDRTGWWLAAAAFVGAVVLGLIATGLLSDSFTGPGGALSIVAVIAVVVTALVLLIFFVTPGTAGRNRFGPDPYASDGEADVSPERETLR